MYVYASFCGEDLSRKSGDVTSMMKFPRSFAG